jgi:hypothetical protein
LDYKLCLYTFLIRWYPFAPKICYFVLQIICATIFFRNPSIICITICFRIPSHHLCQNINVIRRLFFPLSLSVLLPDLTLYMSNMVHTLWTPEFTPCFLVGFVFLIFLVFCVVLLCVFTFLVPCCDVRYDFHIKNNVWFVFTPKLFVGGLMSYLCYLCLFA